VDKRSKIVAIIVLAIALTGFALFFYIKSYIPKFKWNESYSNNSDQPYGVKLLYDLLSQTHSKANFILMNEAPKSFLKGSDSASFYIFVGGNYYIDSVSSQRLSEFVKNGNNAFISSTESTHSIFKKLTNGKRPTIYYHFTRDSIVDVTFDSIHQNATYQFDYKFFKKRSVYTWAGIDSVVFADTLAKFGFEKLTEINHYYVDCFRIKYGKGWFIFHFNPLLLTNYSLSGRYGYAYVNDLLSDYNKKAVFWDEFSKSTAQNDDQNSPYESPLRFVLSEKSLRWSWYLICVFVLLFVVVNSKRKQAPIPLMPVNRNTTIEYINSIAMLYYQSDALEFLADEILKQLLVFIKHKYGISPNLEKSEIARLLAPKSGIEEDTLNRLFKCHMGVKYSPVYEVNDLIEFHTLTEYFYNNCK
jgi:hypothetical protein